MRIFTRYDAIKYTICIVEMLHCNKWINFLNFVDVLVRVRARQTLKSIFFFSFVGLIKSKKSGDMHEFWEEVRYLYPARLLWSVAARKAAQTFVTLLAPMLELLPMNWFKWIPIFLYSLSILQLIMHTIN